MKKLSRILSVLLILAVAMVAGVFLVPAFGSATLAIAALPTQQIIFSRQLQADYIKLDTWLNEAQDLSSFVEGGQKIVFPEAGAPPVIYKNQTTDIDAIEPTEGTHDSELDVYDSQNFRMRDINMYALPFNKIAYYTGLSSTKIMQKETMDAAYTFTPSAAGNKIVIIPTTGAARTGLKMMTLNDVVTLARACDNAGFPDEGRNLVLPSDLWWDLVQNNDILKLQLSYQANTGMINPNIVNYYGFKIHKSWMSNAAVAYNITTAAKAAQGAIITGNVVPAGFVFCANQVYRASGMFKMYYLDSAVNTTGRATEFGFQHRFKADFTKDGEKYSAMIYQDVAV